MAISYDAVSTSKANSATSLAWNHTVAAQSNRILLVGLSFRVNTVTNVAVTFNGVSMTLVTSKTSGDSTTAAYLFYLLAPATGTHSISASWTTSSNIVGGGISAYGVNQTTPYRTPATTGGSSTGDPFSISVTSATGELVVDVAAHANDAIVASGGTQTSRYTDFAVVVGGGGSTAPGASSVTMEWNPSSSTHWAMVAVSLKPVQLLGTSTITGTASATASLLTNRIFSLDIPKTSFTISNYRS